MCLSCLVRRGWRRIYSLSLFVEHMMLGVEDVDQNLKPLILEHTRRLAQVSHFHFLVSNPFCFFIALISAADIFPI